LDYAVWQWWTVFLGERGVRLIPPYRPGIVRESRRQRHWLHIVPVVHRIVAPVRRQSRRSRAQIVLCLVLAMIGILGGCSSHGSAGIGGARTSTSDSAGVNDALKATNADSLATQCSLALTSAEGFVPTWKSLANQGTSPTLEQRQALAAQIQTYVNKLADQLQKITDTTLAAAVQQLQGEMCALISSLNSGTAVDLSDYNDAVKTTKAYCDK